MMCRVCCGWIALQMCLLGAVVASSDSVVVFSEIMYHPPSEEESEWVELHNQMSLDIDLSRWRIEGGIDFSFPEGTVIPGGGYLVVAAKPELMEEAMGPFTRQLSNAGETLRLLSASGRMMNRVRYDDGGEWPRAADGSGASLALVQSDSTPEQAANWTWSDRVGGTPGAENFSGGVLPERAFKFNEVTEAKEEGFAVELVNASAEALDINGYVLRSRQEGNEVDFVVGSSLPSGGLHVLPMESGLDGDVLFLYSPGKERVLDAIQVVAVPQIRFPDGAEWVNAEASSVGEPNMATFNESIVINEILYHDRPQYATEEIPFAASSSEWIELYNRSEGPVDLSAWALSGSVDYVFPEGSQLGGGDYLVVAKGSPKEGVDGFEGRLPNRSGTVELRDRLGNVVDEVTYFDDGDWPKAADGGGSSLELRDPWSDNNKALAWAASEESHRTQWQEIRYRGVAERSSVGQDSQWRELVIGLLDEGEVLLDDIKVVEDPDGKKVSLINNSSFSPSIFGGGPLRNWRLRGNHRHGEVVSDPEDPDNRVLHLRAGGATGHMHNHIEITLSGGARITNGETYEISFRARPVSGSPQVLTRLYFNRLAKTSILQTPSEVGTPGEANSQRSDAVGPVLWGLRHEPAVPDPGEPCRVVCRASDPDGVADLVLRWRVGDGEFSELAMVATGDGEYAVEVPGQAADAVVQFFVEAVDGEGAASRYPAAGPRSGALYQVKETDRLSDGPLNHFRIIMAPEEVQWLHQDINLMSDDRLPATVIYKEREIFYGAGVRLKGSERGRVTVPRLGFNVKFPTERRFRGVHRTVAVDRSEGVGYGQFEMLFNQMMTHSGALAAEYNDLIHVMSPQDRHTGAAELQLARYGSVFLNSQFEDGSDGNLYEYELIYYPTTANADGYKRPQPDSVVGANIVDLGDEKEAYRWIYLLKNNRPRDDFASVMEYAKLFSKNGDAFQEALPDLVDVDAWLQGMASALVSGSGDQYGANSQHNGMFYMRPDGKFMFFPHDLDFAHSVSRSITENRDLQKIIRNPGYERIYLAYVNNLIKTSFNAEYMTRWAEHFGELLPGQRFDRHLDYVIARSENIKRSVGRAAPTTPFAIATESGLTVTGTSVELQGTGSINLHRFVDEETGAIYEPTWIDLDTWRLSLPVVPGENRFALQGVDVLGGKGSIFAPIGRGVFTVTAEGGAEEPVTAVTVERAGRGNRGLSLRYLRAPTDGLVVVPEYSSDLVTWMALDNFTETIEPGEEAARDRVTIEWEADEAVKAGFIRLRLGAP